MGKIYNSEQLDLWKVHGNVITSQGGTFCKITLSGTAAGGGVTNRYVPGVAFAADLPCSLLFLNGTAYETQLRNIPAGAYNWNFAVCPRSDTGTSMTVILDASEGTMCLNVMSD